MDVYWDIILASFWSIMVSSFVQVAHLLVNIYTGQKRT